MSDPSPTGLQAVIDGDWCIGCGACTGVDPTIDLVLDERRGSYRPSHPGSHAAAAVCPAIQVDITALGERLFPTSPKGPHGAIDRVWLAQNTDADENLKASSGGVIRPILRELLASGEVAGAIALTEVTALRYEQSLLGSPSDVDRLPGSIYHVVEHSQLYRILEGHEGPLAVVGIPCQLEGLRLFLESQEGRRHKEKVKITIGLFCGWQYTAHAIRALGTYLRFDPNDITSIAYRGGGPVGKLRIDLADGGRRTLNRRVDYSAQVAFDRSFNLPRCHLCVNHSNLLADIAVGDAWLPETVFSRTGVSLVVSRTPKASEVVGRLAIDGTIRFFEIDDSAIERSQGRNVAYGDSAYGLADALSSTGVEHPTIVAPNRPQAQPTVHDEALEAWRLVIKKRRLQQEGRYRWLWIRKGTLELPALLRRLLRSRLIGRYLRATFGNRTEGSSSKKQLDLDGFA